MGKRKVKSEREVEKDSDRGRGSGKLDCRRGRLRGMKKKND